ncbi:hypothetical protein ACFOGJ_08995 [Marinibaculum pumilum]|uniref:Uncharacterized protein n=1 Tax=Marinibaculum pumilum TaxID=1766165 RepID=A0ABV7KYU2_9PROT
MSGDETPITRYVIQRKDIEEALDDSRMLVDGCPSCHSKDLSLSQEDNGDVSVTFLPSINADTGSPYFGKGHVVVPIFCRNCGYGMFFHLRALLDRAKRLRMEASGNDG